MYQKQSRPDDTTRRLSASVHYDQRRAQSLLDLIVGHRHRFLVRYEDINTSLVTSYAASAIRTWRLYCIVAVGALLLSIVMNLIAADRLFEGAISFYAINTISSTVFVLLILWVAGFAIRLLGDYGGSIVGGTNRAAIVVAWILALPMVAVSLFSLGSTTATLVLGLFVVFLVYLQQAYSAHRLLVERFQAENWDATARPTVEREYQTAVDTIADDSEAVNSTIYSGFSPFVGAGLTDSFFRDALEVVPAESLDETGSRSRRHVGLEDLPPRPSEVQIMAELIPAMETLDLPNFRARRWHFVHGLHAGVVDRSGADQAARPSGSIDGPAVVDGRISDEFARSYLWLSSSLWGGEVVLNTFVRLVPGQFGMFMEISHHVLPPIDKWSTRCEGAVPLEGLDLFIEMSHDAAVNVTFLPKSIVWFVLHRVRWARIQRRVRRLVSKSLAVDRGAYSSIRDLFTTGEFDHYFQAMDSLRYWSIINASLLTKIDEALRETGWAIANLDEIVKNLQNITITNSTFGDNTNVGKGNTVTTTGSTGGSGKSGGDSK